MSRAQDNAIEHLSLANAGESLAIRDGYDDRHVDVTARSGQCWHLSEDGTLRETIPNHSIRWETR